jgi:hypothetical protein
MISYAYSKCTRVSAGVWDKRIVSKSDHMLTRKSQKCVIITMAQSPNNTVSNALRPSLNF